MLHRSTIQLLRFHFSFFLLPVYLFAVSQVPLVQVERALLVFGILHLLIYPASNGYNSYMDRDETPIGGLSRPLLPTRQLFTVTLLMDAAAVLFSLLIGFVFTLGIMLYIAASRAYSYRGIRLKKRPVVGFLTVFIFQGGLVFFLAYHGMDEAKTLDVPWLPCLISSLLIGALYPLTQIYQHEEDKKDGVITISYLLGKRGSFVFSMILFLSATLLVFLYLKDQNRLNQFSMFLLTLLPVVLYFLYWMWKVWQDEAAADFRSSLTMNVLSTFCTTIFFSTLIIQNH